MLDNLTTMESAVSYFATFSLGLLSGYLLLRIQDNRQTAKTLSREVYQPLHEDLHRGLQLILRGEPSLENSIWQKIRASGLMILIKEDLRKDLQSLFDETLPAYFKAWFEGTGWLGTTLTGWDERFGGAATSGAQALGLQWWPIISHEEPPQGIPDIGPNTIQALHQRYIGYHTLQQLHVTFPQFVRERWEEVFHAPELENFRARRRAALTEIPAMLSQLANRIRP